MLWKLQREIVFFLLVAVAGLFFFRNPQGTRAEAVIGMVSYQRSFAREIFLENQRLRSLSGFSAQEPLSVAGAGKVIALDPIGRPAWLLVESKTAAAQERPLFALDREGNLVGRVTGRRGQHLTVMTLINNESRVSVSLQESRNLGVMESTGPLMNLAVNYIGNSSRVMVGETVVTSSIGRTYPPGIPVGVVRRAAPGPSLFQEVTVSANVNFSRLEEVAFVY